MLRRSCFLLPLLVSMPCLAEKMEAPSPIDAAYKSVALWVGSGTTNQDWLEGSNASFFEVEGLHRYSSNVLVSINYSAQFFHPESYTIRLDRALISAGYRYALHEQLDIYAFYGLGGFREEERQNKTDTKLNSEKGMLTGGKVGFYYFATDKLSVQVEGEFTRTDWVDEDNAKLSVAYQWGKRFGCSAFYKYRDAGKNYINEAGISLKWVY
ncbi:outer membrane beta-barrel protein [Vibrio sp. IRLE0018]|uniref:outer membrane beta-barrel protein n=2 Tax=Vibrio TaxID=662 RepID=UPI001592C290|nr:outer membrane beta-barrel protein [Vibrio sp. 05-20-BW147]MCF8778969.1 outer membrane beta-barrel protein [Vibrio floridensis]NVC61888.1 porin family protein [Vibrio sp. 05-20-BW147]